MENFLNETDFKLDGSIVLKTLKLVDPYTGVTHYYTAMPQEIERYKYWKQLFEQTEGKELSWSQYYGMDPIDGPDGFYNLVGSGMGMIVQIKKGEIITKEMFPSGESYIFSHIERYYEEQQTQSTDPTGSMRIEGAEVY